jgi:hypothetical protein
MHPESRKLLSMDIEGSEWDFFDTTYKRVWEEFSVIVIEIHGLHRAFDPEFFENKVVPMMQTLSSFRSVHIHANNSGWLESSKGFFFPSLLELTLVKEDWLPVGNQRPSIPHRYDAPNLPERPDLDFRGLVVQHISSSSLLSPRS